MHYQANGKIINDIVIDRYFFYRVGEENDIIIVSLVRSNQRGELGFVKTQNRICVTLSRAKFGMYVLGNFEMLSKGSGNHLNIPDIH